MRIAEVISTRSFGGGELGLKPCSGLTTTQAISLARALMAASDAGDMSLSGSTSVIFRSFPGPGCTPSHQPWYAPAKHTTSLRRLLNAASRTAHMIASVPDMWNETSSSLETALIIARFSPTIGCSGEHRLEFFVASQPSSIQRL